MSEPLTEAERDAVIGWATGLPLFDETWQSVYLTDAALNPPHNPKHRAASFGALFDALRTPLAVAVYVAAGLAAVLLIAVSL